MKYFPSGYRTRYSPRVSDSPYDYVGSRREALDAELAHEEEDAYQTSRAPVYSTKDAFTE